MSEPIGVAFAGCTHPHIVPRIALLAATPDVRLAGCYDPDAELAAALEQRFGLRAFAQLDELLDQSDIKLVVIEGWDPDNPGYVRAALRRRQAILLEKPGTPNLAAMQELAAEVRRTPVPFQIAYQLRFSSVIASARQILASGVLGPVTLARFHAAAPVGGAAEPWQSVPGDTGGVLYTDGCHMVDLIVQLLGVPRQVQGQTLVLPAGPPVLAHGFKRHTLASPGETVEMAMGGLMYEDAAAAVFAYGDKLVSFDMTGWEAHPWVESWTAELYGTNGSLFLRLQPPAYHLYLRDPRNGCDAGWHRWEAPGSVDRAIDPTYQREMEHLLNRVRRWDVDNEPWVGDGVAVIQILTAIFESARTRRAVDMRDS